MSREMFVIRTSYYYIMNNFITLLFYQPCLHKVDEYFPEPDMT